MDRTEEKINLMAELGIEQGIEKKKEAEAKKIVEELVGMKFKIITKEEIEKKICSFEYEIEKMQKRSFFSFDLQPKKIKIKQKPMLDSMSLKYWHDNIPLGGLYAVKEATEKGLKHFKIFYPSTSARYLRRHDPVIVGYAQEEKEITTSLFIIGNQPSNEVTEEMKGIGPMLEVFAWDDSKVYD